MPNKVLIIGGEAEKANALAILALKEKYGEDVIIITAEEAQEQKISLDVFVNLPSLKITPTPIFEFEDDYKSGKELRRERRKKIRKERQKKLKH